MTALANPHRSRDRIRVDAPIGGSDAGGLGSSAGLDGFAGGRGGRRFGDPVIWIAALVLSGLGLLAIYSATRGLVDGDRLVRRQLSVLVVSLVSAVVVSRLDHRRLGRWRARNALLIVTALALLAVLSPLGSTQRGTRGWLNVFGLTIQPAEPAKITLIIALSGLLASAGRRRFSGATMTRRFVGALVILVAISGLVLLGGETGSVMVYAAIGLTVLAGAEVPKRLLALLVASAVALAAFALTSDVLQPYQRDRLESFLDLDADPQGSGYHQRQSLAAIGSGGLAGKGLFNGPQTQLRFLPEQHTDFVFAVVGEEIGFVGGLTIIMAQGVLLARLLALSRPGGDRFGELVCLGVFAYLGFQSAQNIAMNLGLMPIAGIPLPFVSYGGSSLLTSFVAIGLVQGIARQRAGRPSHLSAYQAR